MSRDSVHLDLISCIYYELNHISAVRLTYIYTNKQPQNKTTVHTETCHRNVSSGGNMAAGVFTSFPGMLADERHVKHAASTSLNWLTTRSLFCLHHRKWPMTREEPHKQRETLWSPRLSFIIQSYTSGLSRKTICTKDPDHVWTFPLNKIRTKLLNNNTKILLHNREFRLNFYTKRKEETGNVYWRFCTLLAAHFTKLTVLYNETSDVTTQNLTWIKNFLKFWC